LTGYYIKNFNQKLRKRVRGLSPEVTGIFRHYQWPGNVRELRNVIERVMILEDGDLITTTWLPSGTTPKERVVETSQESHAAGFSIAAQRAPETPGASVPEVFRLPPEGVQLESVEMSLVEQAMKRSGGNQTRAAELLGISRDQLRYRLKKLESHGADV
jgi:transcriptional regulator with PAS, ATPase and Fis domain